MDFRKTALLFLVRTVSTNEDFELGVRGDQAGDLEAPPGSGSTTIARDNAALQVLSTEAYFRAASANLAMRPDTRDPGTSSTLLRRHYGMTGTIASLSSEIECTDAVDLPDGRQLILKTSTRAEAVDSFRFQTAVLEALQGGTAFAAPRMIRTDSDTLTFEDEAAHGYLQTRLQGTFLNRADPTPELLFQAGRALAHLGLALANVEVAEARRPVLWHVGCWSRLTELEQYLPAGEIVGRVHRAMTDYADFVLPDIATVTWQITHNDPSPFNMMITDEGVGFIDFGDGCWGPRIQDLAIAASHFITDATRPLGGAEHLIAGYASVIKLSSLEAKLLLALMRARQSALILINSWRSSLFPSEAQYIKKNVARAENGLAILASLSLASGEEAVLAAASSTLP